MKSKGQKYTFEELTGIMAKLRDPVSGCPWDREQNFKTIAPYTLEEAYEVADAIDRNDMDDLREELGDLLLQPVYHAQMASEAGSFNIEDVVDGIARKMVERHPHVFGDASAQSAEEVNSIWDQKKKGEAERKRQGQSASALEGVPPALPALLKAQKLQSKAAKVGFEWKNIQDVLNKLEEELKELLEAVHSGSKENSAEELGDVLFVLVNLGRKMGINSEEALRQCNNKFERRFRGLESDFIQQGRPLSSLLLEEMTDAWIVQKKTERKYK
ncbi:MAG: nucleoside triphosphate pyrophosphohydrolase [Alphaproteobacteria bacterium]|nr:nucleoside triphosphate pyrophosphohydrolase [Alphaproteobacteria bacterium]QQS56344.1 MAG: nucleoside triphosphate pyrophosphohydrolase [Alphaproteobacteria bacterium]